MKAVPMRWFTVKPSPRWCGWPMDTQQSKHDGEMPMERTNMVIHLDKFRRINQLCSFFLYMTTSIKEKKWIRITGQHEDMAVGIDGMQSTSINQVNWMGTSALFDPIFTVKFFTVLRFGRTSNWANWVDAKKKIRRDNRKTSKDMSGKHNQTY